MFGKKERKRISLRRDYIGDYIGFLDNAALRALMGNARGFFRSEARPAVQRHPLMGLGWRERRVRTAFPGKQTQVIFADNITKYDRRYKPQPRTMLVTTKEVDIIAFEKATEGPNKGKEVHVFKRQINIATITSLTVR